MKRRVPTGSFMMLKPATQVGTRSFVPSANRSAQDPTNEGGIGSFIATPGG